MAPELAIPSQTCRTISDRQSGARRSQPKRQGCIHIVFDPGRKIDPLRGEEADHLVAIGVVVDRYQNQAKSFVVVFAKEFQQAWHLGTTGIAPACPHAD
jgi:hypothetical protein